MTSTFYSQREAALGDFQAMNLKNKNLIDQCFASLSAVEPSLQIENWPAGTQSALNDILADAKNNPDDSALQDQNNRRLKLEEERLAWIGRGQISVAVWNALSGLMNGLQTKDQTKASLNAIIESL